MKQSEQSLYRQVSMHPESRIAPSASIVGNVVIGRDVTVLSGVRIRGDVAPVSVGDESNVQENCVIHTYEGHPVVVHERVSIGHGAIIHGCEIGRDTLVGMGAIVLNGAKIGPESVVAAGAVVTEGKEFPARSMIMGAPGRLVRTLSDEDVERLCAHAADEYLETGSVMLSEGLLKHPRSGADIHLCETIAEVDQRA